MGVWEFGSLGVEGKQIVRIEYCQKCRWMLRAAWMAQELLSAFDQELGGVTLAPGEEAGVFDISIGSQLIWSRKLQNRFPDIKELKQLVRDTVAPEKDLGHADRPVEPNAEQPKSHE